MRCKACHYSLKKLVEHRCPECGRGFDPADARTFEGEGGTVRGLVSRGSYMLLVVGVVYAASLLLVLGAAPLGGDLLGDMAGVAVLAFGLTVVLLPVLFLIDLMSDV